VRVPRWLIALSLALNVAALIVAGLVIYPTRDSIVTRVRRAVAPAPAPEPRRYVTQRLEVFETLRRRPIPKRLLLYAGDSFVETFEWEEAFAELTDSAVLNRRISGSTLDDLLDSFDVLFTTVTPPDRIFLMVGTNDAGRNGFVVEPFVEKYFVLLHRLQTLTAP
jgi:hypothetical protein